MMEITIVKSGFPLWLVGGVPGGGAVVGVEPGKARECIAKYAMGTQSTQWGKVSFSNGITEGLFSIKMF